MRKWLARYAKARMPLVGLLALMVLLVGAPTTSAAPGMQDVGSAPGTVGANSGNGPQYTHRMTEKVRVSDALCAKLKAANPAQASNPDLCTFTHGAEWTDLQPLTPEQQAAAPQASMATTQSCPSGTASYFDWESSPYRYELDLKTSWAWYGDCAPPTLTRLICYVGGTFATDITNQKCYQYTYPATNPNRRAGVYTAHVIEHWPVGDYTYDTGQRRECFNTGASSCYWTSWDGVP